MDHSGKEAVLPVPEIGVERVQVGRLQEEVCLLAGTSHIRKTPFVAVRYRSLLFVTARWHPIPFVIVRYRSLPFIIAR